MYFKEGAAQEMEMSGSFKIILIALALIVILLGIFPQVLTGLIYNIYF